MKFTVDSEAKKALQDLCDIALKTGGIQNLVAVQVILSNVQDIEKVDNTEKETDKNLDKKSSNKKSSDTSLDKKEVAK